MRTNWRAAASIRRLSAVGQGNGLFDAATWDCGFPDVGFRILDREMTVFVEQRAVDEDLAAVFHVVNHIPVQFALVDATAFGQTRTDCHVDGAAYFLVEQRGTGDAVDAQLVPMANSPMRRARRRDRAGCADSSPCSAEASTITPFS